MSVRKKSAPSPKIRDLEHPPKGSAVLKVWIEGKKVKVTDPGNVSKGKNGHIHWVTEGCVITGIDFGAGSPFTFIDYCDRHHVISGPIRDEVESDTKWAYTVYAMKGDGVILETDPRMIIDL